MALSTNHQCPSCTGPLHFDAKTNFLVCDYCDSKFTVEEIDKLYGNKVEDSVNKGMDTESNRQNAEASGTSIFKTYTCSSCGAQLFCDEVTVATSCPYCSNPNVIAGKFNGSSMPDVVIPFKMEKKQAVEALSKFYKGKKLLPKVFTKQNHVEEIKGVYIPFWLYSGTADVKIKGDGTKKSVSRTSQEIITTISHYDIERSGKVPFIDVPVDASVKMDNDMMDSLEPFIYDDMKNFSPSYLPGFLAEVYDDSPENCQSRLDDRVRTSAIEKMKSDIRGYDSFTVKHENVRINLEGKPRYALLPVWLLSTKWNDKNYLFAMNGQTGKMVGKLPVSWGRFFAWFLGLTAGLGAVLTPIVCFIMTKAGV